ncbi:hypothetical protein T07_11849 [Trichinella nelsoni]|uniref:Uncharacterized protein n=1 Tax=Trichinella nelsoni TaxID=6336 RepID=A0A0V0SCC9_9BILA|nr:hypothetical protein T07_11849 [Trichinella nelsoni]
MNIWNGNLNSSDAKRCGSETAAACRVDQTGPAKASCNSTVGILLNEKIHDNVKTNRRWQARHWPQLAAQRTCLSQEQAWTDRLPPEIGRDWRNGNNSSGRAGQTAKPSQSGLEVGRGKGRRVRGAAQSQCGTESRRRSAGAWSNKRPYLCQIVIEVFVLTVHSAEWKTTADKFNAQHKRRLQNDVIDFQYTVNVQLTTGAGELPLLSALSRLPLPLCLLTTTEKLLLKYSTQLSSRKLRN